MDVSYVKEVTPAVPTKVGNLSISGCIGFLDYRGYEVPVIDLSLALLGKPSELLLSTRYAICFYAQNIYLGLMVTRMTDFYDTVSHDYIRIERMSDADPDFLCDGYKIYIEKQPYYYFTYHNLVKSLQWGDYLSSKEKSEVILN